MVNKKKAVPQLLLTKVGFIRYSGDDSKYSCSCFLIGANARLELFYVYINDVSADKS